MGRPTRQYTSECKQYDELKRLYKVCAVALEYEEMTICVFKVRVMALEYVPRITGTRRGLRVCLFYGVRRGFRVRTGGPPRM